jgi:GNAT superfamily N-acetyltransferase
VEVRPLGGFEEVERAVAIHNRVLPHDPTSTESLVLLRASELDRVDLVATLDGKPVGVGSLAGDLNSLGSTHPFVSVVVDPAHCRRGAGTALLEQLSDRVRRLDKAGLHCEVRADDADALGFMQRRGFEEFDRSEQMSLDTDGGTFTPRRPPDGVDLVWLTDRPDLMAGLHAIAEQTYPETSSTTVRRAGTQHEWMLYELGDPAVLLSLTPIALADGEPIGFSTVCRVDDGTVVIRMTTVVQAWRQRGVARSLVTAQVEAARAAGYRTVLGWSRGTVMRDLMRSIGFEPRTEILDLRGPLQPAV